jgi:dipeptidyl aminopeptidase/acylaminoacyl peptidase
LPPGGGPHPALVWVHGAGQARRLPWGPLVSTFIQNGVAVLSFDKRGVGESQGTCCPGDKGQFNLLTADEVGAVFALASRSDIDAKQIGLIGASQAGWIAPKAALVSRNVAFVALASATPVTERQANLYERLAGGEQGQLTREEISRRLKDAGPSGFDPLPDLKQMTVPSLWLFGAADDRVPVDESVAILDGLKASGKHITVVVFPGAGHGLLDVPPSDPQALPRMVEWIMQRVHAAPQRT